MIVNVDIVDNYKDEVQTFLVDLPQNKICRHVVVTRSILHSRLARANIVSAPFSHDARYATSRTHSWRSVRIHWVCCLVSELRLARRDRSNLFSQPWTQTTGRLSMAEWKALERESKLAAVTQFFGRHRVGGSIRFDVILPGIVMVTE